jgi:hypothetical protein
MDIFEFSENNSGGSWWLDRKQYDALFAAGWTYEPSEYDLKSGYDKDGFLGDKGDDVPYGWRHGLRFEANSIQEAVESWESATGENFFAGGCPCCGAPFSISNESSDKWEYMSGGYEEMSRPF